MRQTFSVTLQKDGAFELPIDVRALYGEARPAVKMTLLGETIATRVMVYGKKSYLALRKKVREQHGLRGGETLEVELEADLTPRTVTPPKELARELKKSPAAKAGWARLSFTHQREWAEAIGDAKKPETRERRVAQAVAALEEKSRQARARPMKSKTKPPISKRR